MDFFITFICSYLLHFPAKASEAIVTDFVKNPLVDAVLSKEVKNNFQKRFLEAFFDTFESFTRNPAAKCIVKAIKKEKRYKIILLEIFQQCAKDDISIFIENMAQQPYFRRQVATQIAQRFSLHKLQVAEEIIHVQSVINIITQCLERYYHTFLKKMNTPEGLAAILDSTLENRALLRGNQSILEQLFSLLQEFLKKIEKLEANKPPLKFPHQLTNLPAIHPKDVIGRDDDLKKLVVKLKESNKVAVVKGIGGIGKTTLAKLYVQKYKDDYKHVAWLEQGETEADNVKLTFVNHKKLSKSLKLHFSKEENIDQRFERICTALNDIALLDLSKPCLLVIDNATKALQNEDVQESFPDTDNWTILATSRQELSEFEIIPLDKLGKTEAKKLFLKCYKNLDLTKNDELEKLLIEIGLLEMKALEALLIEIDYHTLMIELLAKTLEESDEIFTISALLDKIQTHEWDDELLDEDIQINHSKDEITLYSHLLKTFSLAKLSQQEKWLLKQFAVLPSTNISTNFLLFDLLAISSHPNRKQTKSVLRGLVKKGWLQNPQNKVYNFHKVLQQAIRYQSLIKFNDLENLINNLQVKLESITRPLEKKIELLPFVSHLRKYLKRESQSDLLLKCHLDRLGELVELLIINLSSPNLSLFDLLNPDLPGTDLLSSELPIADSLNPELSTFDFSKSNFFSKFEPLYQTTNYIPKQLTNLPYINPIDVIGREKDLFSLTSILEKSFKIVVISGVAGIGKTTLAKLYVQQKKNQYRHIAWINQESNSIKKSFAFHPTLINRLGLRFTKDDNQDKRFRVICNALNQLEKPCLLVIDNTTLLLQTCEIQELLPSLGNWRILVTSRQILSRFEVFILGKLKAEKAKELFLKFYKDYGKAEEKDLRFLLKEIDYDTLMIELLAKTLQASFKLQTIAELLRYLQYHKLDDKALEVIIEVGHSHKEIKLYKHFLSTFSLASLNAQEKWLLQQLAVLPSQEIKAKFFLADLLNLPKKQQVHANNALKGLVIKGWLQSTKSNSYELSKPLKYAICYQMPITFYDVKALVTNLSHKLGSSKTDLEQKVIFLSFAQHLLRYLKESNASIGWLCVYTGNIYKTIGALPLALTYQKQASIVFGNIGEAYGLSITFQYLGDIYQIQGKINKATVFFEKYKQLNQKLCKIHPNEESFKMGLAISYEKLGRAYLIQGFLEKAIVFFKMYNQYFEELCTKKLTNEGLKSSLAVSYERLGTVFYAKGNLTTALDFFEKNNKLYLELHINNPLNKNFKAGLAISYERLGTVFYAKRNLINTFDYFNKYGKYFKELCANNPHNENFRVGLAISYERLGAINYLKREFTKAIRAFKKYHEQFDNLLASNPTNESFKISLAISYEKLGSVYYVKKQFTTALDFLSKYNELCEELYKFNPHNYQLRDNLAISYFKLSEIYRVLEKKETALIFYQKTLPIWNALYKQTKLPKFSIYLKYVKDRIMTL